MSLVKKWFLFLSFITLATLILLPATSSFCKANAPKWKDPDKAKAAKDDIFDVPDGNPKEMVAYLKKLQKSCPNPRLNRRAYVTYIIKSAKPTWEAADKILDAKKSTKQQKKFAAEAKYSALSILLRLKNKDAAEEMKKMPKLLKKLGLSDLARKVEWVLFQQEVRRTLAGDPDAKPMKEILETLKAKVVKTPDKNGLILIHAIVEDDKKHDSVEKAVAICNEFTESLSKSHKKEAATMVKKIQGYIRRMQLMGNTMEIEGTLVDGKSLNWSDYKGKVVLVQFWATWCRPCRAEIPNVLKYYKLYHDRGFDVVSISLDHKREDLEKFLDKNELPWPVIFVNGKENEGFDAPMAIRYAVTGIPTLILLDSKGKVVSEKARGRLLGKELEKLLGPAKEDQKEDENSEE